ncbi:MAG: hypothetical protein CFE21_07055 [Bacteroidetes bacterium B1(2017)]|nr:MAG: hypothetical protein CFE21_07055 [Bacteroidetes bacterium B1(2017)]
MQDLSISGMHIDNEYLKYKPNLKKRIFASILDYAIYFLSFFVYIMFFGTEIGNGEKTVTGLMFLPIPIFWFCYFVLVEYRFGGTFGHLAFHLKVLTLKRKEIEFSQALKRHLIDPIDVFMYGIPAMIAILNSEKHQRIGDMWAGTCVIDLEDFEQINLEEHS